MPPRCLSAVKYILEQPPSPLMSQFDQFAVALHAPLDWVRQVDGKAIASARWQGGSYGNVASPPWIRVDDQGTLHAQAFYYASENPERFEKRFGDEPHVAVSIIHDEEIPRSCCVSPDTFVAALTASAGIAMPPGDTLRQAIDATAALTLTWWQPD